MIDSLDNRNDIITDLLIEAFDLGKLMEEYEAHYQRGFEAGKASIGAEQLKTEFERGRESYRDELLAEIQKRNAPPAPKAPIAESIEEKPASETKSIAISKPEKNLGGRPNQSGRPDGLPRNLDMALEAIKELGGRAAAPQILAYVRKKWWAGFPTHWTANLYDFVKEKKLERDGINFVALDSKAPAAQDVLPKEPLKIPMPTVKPTAGPRPPAAAPASRPQAAIPFEHEGRSAMLATSREYSMASRLKKAMGTGHVAEGFLAQNVIGSNTEHTRMLVKDLCLGMNPALLSIGLKIEHYPGFGLLMKDAG